MVEEKHINPNVLAKVINVKKLFKKYLLRFSDTMTPGEIELLPKYVDSILQMDPKGHHTLGYF
jgi:hypothetical protein